MANVLNILLKNTAVCPIRHAIKTIQLSSIIQFQVRNLYSKTTLGIDNYEMQRQRTQSQLSNITEKFKTKMHDYTSEGSTNMIFTEDLKNMVHLALAEDMELVIKMMNRFNEQNKELRFGNFIFGPVVMRMFHHLNKVDEALKCFNSPELNGFFDQLMSYQILLDLLYENGRFKEMLEAFDSITKRQIENTKYPRNIVVLTMAACYKINTAESLQFALKVWKDLAEVGHLPMRRAATFCAGLAIHQNQPEAALEVLSTAKNQNYTTIRNLKVLALVAMGRMEDTMPILKSVLNQDTPIKHTFNKDVLNTVRGAVEKDTSSEIKDEFQNLEKQLSGNGHVSEMTMDEQLCMEIATPPFLGNKNMRTGQQMQQNMRYNRYQKFDDNNDRRRQFNDRRPGLYDMQ